MIRQNAQSLRAILMAAMDAVITTDESQHIVLANPAAALMFRCTQEEMHGAPLVRFIPARYRSEHPGHVERFGATGVSSRKMGAERRHRPARRRRGVPGRGRDLAHNRRGQALLHGDLKGYHRAPAGGGGAA